jgi:hypothetical protein
MNSKKHTIGLMIMACLLIMACQRKEPTTWNTSLAFPIAKGTLGLNDLVADSLLYYDENCLWHLKFSEELTEFNIDTLVAIPDTTIRKSFVVGAGPFTVTLQPGFQLYDEFESTTLKLNDVKLREVFMKSGYLEYTIKSYVNGYLNWDYELPGLTYNGVAASIEAVTSPTTDDTNPSTLNGVFDLTDYHLNLGGEDGFGFNKAVTHLTLVVDPGNNIAATVSGDDSVVVELKFIDPVLSYARGYFGQHEIQVNEIVDLGLNFNMPTGILNIDEADVGLGVINYLGADAKIHFGNLSCYNSVADNSVYLNYSPLFDPINVTRAYDNNGIIEPALISFDLNNSNSNIAAFLENLPNQFTVDGSIQINPLGDVMDGNDFVYADQTIETRLDIDIPLRIAMNNFVMQDTLELSDIENLTNVSGKLFLEIENYFPFSADIKLDLLNSDGNLIRSIINNQPMSSASLTAIPGNTNAAQSSFEIDVDAILLGELKAGNKLLMRINLNTPGGNSPVGIYKWYKMNFKLYCDIVTEVSYD